MTTTRKKAILKNTLSTSPLTPHDMSEFAQLPSFEKVTFIADLIVGEEVRDVFLLGAAQQLQAKNGPYWRLEFKDNSGAIGGKIWSPHSQLYPDLTPGVLVCVIGRVGSYKDTPELNIESLHILSEQETAQIDLSQFLQSSLQSPEEMFLELKRLCKQVMAHKPWKKFTSLLLEDKEISFLFKQAAAAKAMHHAYVGGLLEHTLSVCKVCMQLADHYPQLDRQTLLAGALCHDLGKIWELTSGLHVDYTQQGRLLGHIPLALEKLSPFLQKSGLEPELVEHLQHLILSHHGSLEFGSPKLPATAEALILHYADNIDAKMQQVQAALSGLEPGISGWSAYTPSLERFLFRAVPTPFVMQGKTTENGSAPIKKNRQEKNEAPQPLPLLSQCSLLSKE